MGKYLGAILTVAAGVAIIFGLATGLGTWAIEQPAMNATSNGTDLQTGLKKVTLTLQTFPNSPDEAPMWEAEHNYSLERPSGVPILNTQNGPASGPGQADWVTYGPTTALTLPAHALVTMYIENYDGSTSLLNPYYAIPRGTVDGALHVCTATNPTNITPCSEFDTETQVDPTNISHTFTIHSVVQSQQPWLFVSVPITAVPDNQPMDNGTEFPLPVVTMFQFVTQGPGHYIWQCFDPCGYGYDGFGGAMSTKGYMSGTLDVVG
jgi:hypothetical protein